MSDDTSTFINFVQLHERAWGMNSYPDRPKLDEIIGAPVVACWYAYNNREKRFTISIHPDLQDLERYFVVRILNLQSRLPEKRLARLYIRGKRARIKAIKLQYVLEP